MVGVDHPEPDVELFPDVVLLGIPDAELVHLKGEVARRRVQEVR